MKTTFYTRILLVFLSFAFINNGNAQTGTADGVYNFGSLGTANSGGAGFRTQADKFKVSNVFVQDRKSIFADNATPGATQSIIIKAEGGTVNRTFTFKDLTIQNFSQSTDFDIFIITLRNYFGAQIAQLSLNGNQLLGTSLTSISTFNFAQTFQSAGYIGVSEIQVDYRYADPTISPDELTFRSINVADVSSAIPLPLSLLDFSAKKEGSGVRIIWTTTNEVNVAKNVVEYSRDGRTFTAVASFPGQKSSSVKTGYTFFHASPAIGKNYYRLKEIDVDGSEKIFVVRTVDIGGRVTLAIESTNPVSGPIHIQGLSAGTYSLELIDMNGRSLVSSNLKNLSGSYTFEMPAAIPRGTYVLVIAGNGQRVSQKLMKQ